MKKLLLRMSFCAMTCVQVYRLKIVGDDKAGTCWNRVCRDPAIYKGAQETRHIVIFEEFAVFNTL